jgi:hypothetical protein
VAGEGKSGYCPGSGMEASARITKQQTRGAQFECTSLAALDLVIGSALLQDFI